MDNVKEEEKKPFSFGIEIPPDTPITAESVEAKILEVQEPKKRGRKPGTTNKPVKEVETPAYVKAMFKPVIVGAHNGLLKLLKLSMMDNEQEKMVIDGYAMLLNKRIPNIIENHGDIIAAIGGTAFVLMAKLGSETKIFEFKIKEKTTNGNSETRETKQHNNNPWAEGLGEDSTVKVPIS